MLRELLLLLLGLDLLVLREVREVVALLHYLLPEAHPLLLLLLRHLGAVVLLQHPFHQLSRLQLLLRLASHPLRLLRALAQLQVKRLFLARLSLPPEMFLGAVLAALESP